MKIPFKKTREGISIQVKVQPRSSRKGVEGVVGEALKVNLTAPPAEGAANEQLIEVLSEAFGVGKSSVGILRGHSSRNKVVEIKGLKGI